MIRMRRESFNPIIKFNLSNINQNHLDYPSADAGESLFPPSSLLWYRSIIEPLLPFSFVVGIMIGRKLFSESAQVISGLAISVLGVFLFAIVIPYAIAKACKWTRLYKDFHLKESPNLAVPILPFSIRLILRIFAMYLTIRYCL